MSETSLGELEKLDIGGHRLEVLHENGETPYLVFVHGGPGSLWNPIEQIKTFHDSKGVVTYSLSGYGNSDGREDDSLDKHVEDLRKLIETLDLDEVVLHGHSYGTEIVLDYISQYEVEGFIISGGHAHIEPALWEKAVVKLVLGTRLYNLPITENYILRKVAEKVLHGDVDDERFEEILMTTPAPKNRSAWETMPKCFWNYQPPELGNIGEPALFIQGGEDQLVSPELVKETVEELPNAELKIFEDSGHVPMIEERERYNREVEEFLSERVE